MPSPPNTTPPRHVRRAISPKPQSIFNFQFVPPTTLSPSASGTQLVNNMVAPSSHRQSSSNSLFGSGTQIAGQFGSLNPLTTRPAERQQPVSVLGFQSQRTPDSTVRNDRSTQTSIDGSPAAKTAAPDHIFARFLTPSPVASTSQPAPDIPKSTNDRKSKNIFTGSLFPGSAGSSPLSAASAQTERDSVASHNPFARFLAPETTFTPTSGRISPSTNASNDSTSTKSPLLFMGDSASKLSPPRPLFGATQADASRPAPTNPSKEGPRTSDQTVMFPGSAVPSKSTSLLGFTTVNNSSQLDAEFSRLQIGQVSSPPSPSPSRNQFQQAQTVTTTTTTTAAAAAAAADSQPTEAAAAYDVSSEDVPDHPFYLSSFQKSLQFGRELASDTADTIQRIPHRFRDQILNGLLSDAESLSTFQPSAAKTVAILGDSGEGKSSLINSLLHISGLAHTSDAGSACTSVVTEYRYREPRHTAPITIEVEYLDREGIEEMITELLWSYRSLYHPDFESPTTSAEEYERVQRESSEAWSALEAAFGHQSELKEHRFRDQSPGSSERLQRQLIAWSQDIQWPSGSSGGRYTDAVQTAQDCCRSTAIFMSDRYWPFTKVIRVYVDAEVLKAGVTLVDLPGLQDTNLARIKITQDYLMKCDNVFIVAKISRAITDQSLKSSLYAVFSRHMPSEWEDAGGQRRKDFSISVICTKTEDIDIKSAKERFCGQGKAVSKSLSDDLDEQISKAKASGNFVLKKQLKHRREALFIEARNNHVQAGLQKAYISKVPGGKLNVFCVSNRLYEKQCKRGDSTLVTVSGIPKLRNFCRLLGADAQLAQAQDFLKSSLFSLVNSFQLWISNMDAASSGLSISEESKSRILEAYKSLTQMAARGTTTLISDFDVSFKDQILKFGEKLLAKWEEAACAKAKQWEKWHHTQYNAWCRRNGCHTTVKREYYDWNADLVWKMRMELEWQWDFVEEDVPDIFGSLLKTVDASVVSLGETVRASVPSETYSMLNGGMDSSVRHFHHNMKLVQDRLLSEVKLTRRYATETNHMSFILGQMMPTYRKAASQSGTDRWDRQKTIIGNRVGDGLLFPSICVVMQNRHETLTDLLRRQVQDSLQDLTKKIKGDVDSALASIRQLHQAGLVEEMAAVKALVGELKATALWLGEEVHGE